MAKICGEIVIRGIFRSIAIHRFKCLIRARADPPSFGSKSNPEIATSVHGVAVDGNQFRPPNDD
jgi:hypothetical protein